MLPIDAQQFFQFEFLVHAKLGMVDDVTVRTDTDGDQVIRFVMLSVV